MSELEGARGTATPVERVVQVLMTLAATPGGMSLTDLVRATDIPTTTVHRILATLRSSSLVMETADGRHTMGVGAVVLGRAFLDNVNLRDVARPLMQQLVDETGETCHLGVLASPHMVYIEKVDSPHPVRMHSRVGGVNSAVNTAIGRAILAHLPETAAWDVLEHARETEAIAPDFDFVSLMSTTRSQGFSTDIQMNEMGICCVGAAIFDHSGRVVAGLSISTPASRFQPDGLQALGSLVRAYAGQISVGLGWSATTTDRAS